jgi:hypothetical protein
MSEHVDRVQIAELISRLNEYERITPILLVALGEIAGERCPDPKKRAHTALREANHPEGSDA